MTALDPSTANERAPMTALRRTALFAGVSYVLSFASIPTLTLYRAVHDPNYLISPGPDTPVILGGVLEIIVALACVGTAICLYPVVKRQNEALAMGFVGTRTLEAAAIFVGVASLLTVVTLRQAGAGADGLITGQAFVALYDRLFVLGQGLIPAVNALLLGSLLYRSRLVPRVLPVLGLLGAPLLLVSVTATLFGRLDRVSPITGILAIPIAVWELSLGVYLIVKGFKPAPITAGIATIGESDKVTV